MASDDAGVMYSPGADATDIGEKRPYLVVFISDLAAEDRLPTLTPVDKDSLAAFMKKAAPALPLAIKDPLGGGGGEWEFRLTFDSFKAFEPAGIFSQIAAGRWRQGLREKLLDRQSGSITSDDLQRAIDAAIGADSSLAWLNQAEASAASAGGAAPAAPAGGSILDSIADPSLESRVSADVSRLAADAAAPGSRISGGESGRMGKFLDRLDRELGAIADAVLKHPDVRRLETSWRGLRFLVERMDFREGVRLSVLHTSRDDAVDRFIEHVVNPAFDGEIPTPGLIVADFWFENLPPHLEMLDMLAQHAASLPVPLVFPIEAGFFNIKSLRMLKNLPNLSGLADGAPFAKWRSLREKPYAKALAPVLGRFILRAPHAARPRSRDFTFTEKVETINDIVWAGGHLAIAMCAARAYAQHGWPTRMFGAESGKIGDLPIVDNPNDKQSPWGPGDLLLPDRRLDELPTIGLNLLQSMPGKDYCLLLGGVSAAKPIKTAETSEKQAALEISLPYQQFSNIASAWLCEQMPNLRGLNSDDIQKRLIVGLRGLMKLKDAEEDEAVTVGVGPSPDQPGQTIVQVRLSPPGNIAPGGLHVDFGFAV